MRKPDGLDTLVEEMLVAELRMRDSGHLDWLIREGRLSTYISDHKREFVVELFNLVRVVKK